MAIAKTQPYTPALKARTQEQHVPSNDMVLVSPVADAVPQALQPDSLHVKGYVHLESRHPVVLTYCPKCAKEEVGTRTHTRSTGTTWLCVGVGLFVFWPLCWLPLCINPTRQTDHFCQNCGQKIGRVKPFH